MAKLSPKVVIMENVEGLIKGEAWTYVQKIYKQLTDIGYQVKHWLLKGEHMGVPQTRHRVFFIATRLDFDFDDIDMHFNYDPITYGEVKSSVAKEIKKHTKIRNCLEKATYDECDLGFASERLYGKRMFFTYKIADAKRVLSTITAHHGGVTILDREELAYISDNTIINATTFPQDYDFIGQSATYICGMSVPPIMIKRIVTRLIESGLFDYKLRK